MIPESSHIKLPKHCDNCASENIKVITDSATHHESRNVIACEDCGASVGCHSNSDIPLGKMATKATRRLRMQAHKQFDQLWQTGLMTRSKAYNWLARELTIAPDDCHISWLTDSQLRDVATLSANYLTQNIRALERRKAKKDARNLSKTIQADKRRKFRRTVGG